jgi:hypothetical protein
MIRRAAIGGMLNRLTRVGPAVRQPRDMIGSPEQH